MLNKINKAILHSLNSKFYREKFKNCKIPLSSLEDLKTLPFTTHQEAKDISTFHDRIAIDKEDIFHIHSSTHSGLWAMSSKDYFEACPLKIQEKEINIPPGFWISFIPHITWTGAAPMLHAFNPKVKMLTLPPQLIPTHLPMILKNIPITGTIGLPSSFCQMIDGMESKGIDPKSLGIKNIALTGEWQSEFTKNYIFQKMGLERILSFYGSADCSFIALGDATSLKLTASHHYEFINNELIITTLLKEAMPLIRYQTGDMIQVLDKEKNIIRILGRKHEEIQTSSKSIFPIDIEEIIYTTLNKPVNYLITVDKNENIKIQIETDEKNKNELAQNIQNKLPINPVIELLPDGSLSPYRGKVRRLIREKV